MSRDSATKPKYYGSNEITIDAERLARDISSGKVRGTGILTPDDIQAALPRRHQQARAGHRHRRGDRRRAGQRSPTRSPTPGSSAKVRGKVERRLTALFFNTRDGEWLVSGVVPSDYIIHGGHTVPGAAGGAAGSSAANDERVTADELFYTDADGESASFVDVIDEGLEGDLDDRIPALRELLAGRRGR